MGHLEEEVAALQNRGAARRRCTMSAKRPGCFSKRAGNCCPLPSRPCRRLRCSGSVTPAPAFPAPAVSVPPPRRRWLLGEIFAELRVIVRGISGPALPRQLGVPLAPLILIPAILTSWIWLPGTAVLEKVPIVGRWIPCM